VSELSKEFQKYENKIIAKEKAQFVPDDKRRVVGDLFEYEPVPLRVFLYEEPFLAIEALSDEQYKFIEFGTQIYYEETLKQLNWDMVDFKAELIAKWGKGSGKDWCSAIILSRVMYLCLCLKEPLLYYGQSKYSHIDALNMAYSGDQADSNFFAYFQDMIKGSKWFKGKYKIKAGCITFPKKLRAFSGNSFEESFEGKNLLVCVLDEIAAFKTNDEVENMRRRRVRAPRYSADAVYDMASTSVASRFPRGIGKVIALSFTRHKGDFIETLYDAGKGEKTTYVSAGATWDINPRRTKADFEDEYRKNPERAAARYECKPSEKLSAFFKRQGLLEEAFPIITPEENPVTDDRFPELKEWFKPDHNFQCAMHIDLGWKHDAAGIAMAHCYDVIQKADGAQLPVLKMDLATSFIAPVNGEVDFEKVRQFVIELINRDFNIRLITLDGYQSVYFLQTFEKMGIETKLRSVDRTTDAYDDLKSVMYEKRLKGYSAPRNIELAGKMQLKYELRDELKNLIDMGGKKGPEHRVGGIGKDIADALAGAVQGALELGNRGELKDDEIMLGADRVAMAEDANSESTSREYLSPLEEDVYTRKHRGDV